MKNLILTIISGTIFIAYSYNLTDILAQAPTWLAIGGYGIVGASFIILLLKNL
jgi:hypothetical protein